MFRFEIERAADRIATLSVHLAGPISLSRLDDISIVVVPSDDAERVARLPGSPTQEVLDAQVWGPYQFTHGSDGADIHGQTVAPFSLRVGKSRPFSIERTSPPLWARREGADARWNDQWLNRPMRVLITSKKGILEPWVVPYEVAVPQSPRVRTL